ncbi:MAG: dienelactone hydrolase family protein [Deltaproteobacteria bacterium]|nr:dienelactone hydrolase family protein [Deltaproteobacteria bacterium]
MRSPPLLPWIACLAACGKAPAVPGGDDGDDDAGADAPPAVDAPPEAEPCGDRGGERGLTRREVTVGGVRRTYLVYLPPGAPTAAPLPLVFVFHGYTMSGQKMVDATRYTALADDEGIALVFPDGQGGPDSLDAPWNVGAGVCPSFGGPPPIATGDDLAFLDAIKADVAADQCIDRAHVFATGFSMGGYMTHHLACTRADFAGAAPHSGGTHDLAGCDARPVPILILHGAADPVIPAGCDDPRALGVLGTTPSAEAWAAHNGCSSTTTTRIVQGGTCLHYVGCPDKGQVEVCTFTAMGHCWAGGPASAQPYACPGYASSTALSWEFWKTYAW